MIKGGGETSIAPTSVGSGRMAVDSLQSVEDDLEVAGDDALLVLEAAKLPEQDKSPVAFDAGALTGGDHDDRALELLERMGV
jgi:hypothetical protein